MRRVIFIISISINIIAVLFLVRRIIFQSHQISTVPPYALFMKDREQLYCEVKTDSGKVLIVGDSHAELSPFADIFKNCINRGIAGEKTLDLLNRLPCVFAAKPRAVLITIGINDILANIDCRDNLDSIIVYSTARCKVYVNDIMPVAKNWPNASVVNKKVCDVNDFIKQLKNKYSFIDIQLGSRICDGNYLDASYTNDGLHLNLTGYKLMADSLEKYPAFVEK